MSTPLEEGSDAVITPKSALLVMLVAAAAVSFLDPSVAAAAVSCESLAAVRLPNTAITSARMVAAGTFTIPGANERANAAMKNLPGFCLRQRSTAFFIGTVVRPAADKA